MAGKNFKIVVHRSSDSVHLKLQGSFDGSSAHQLLNVMEANAKGMSKIIVHTSGLSDIHPFGTGILQGNLLSKAEQFAELIFTGDNSRELAPEGAIFL